MSNNRDLKDYEDFLANQNSFLSDFKKNVNAIQLIALVGALYLAWYMLKSGGSNSKWYLIGLGVIILIIIFKPNKKAEQEPIPENVIKHLAKIQLERKIGYDTELPPGSEIRMKLEGAMQWQGEWGQPFAPWKWGVGFTVKNQDGLEKEYVCLLHPYKGYITGIKFMKYGYDGSELHDLKVLMPTMFKQDGQSNNSGGLSIVKSE